MKVLEVTRSPIKNSNKNRSLRSAKTSGHYRGKENIGLPESIYFLKQDWSKMSFQ